MPNINTPVGSDDCSDTDSISSNDTLGTIDLEEHAYKQMREKVIELEQVNVRLEIENKELDEQLLQSQQQIKDKDERIEELTAQIRQLNARLQAEQIRVTAPLRLSHTEQRKVRSRFCGKDEDHCTIYIQERTVTVERDINGNEQRKNGKWTIINAYPNCSDTSAKIQAIPVIPNP